MNIGSDTAGLLVKLLLLAVSSFLCLLWAIYVIDFRSNRTGPTDHLTRLDSFVRGIKNRHHASNEADTGTVDPQHTISPDLSTVSQAPPPKKPHWRPSDYSGYIFMDWTGNSDEFDYVNYKSIESLLSVYPKSNVKVNLIAPNAAHYYKTGNLISKHYFQKYLKHGYHVRTEIIYRKFRMRFDNDTLPPGSEYWNAQYLICCESSKATEINMIRTIPAHMYFFLRFFKLWAHGGVYSDFSWMHTREMAVVRTLDFSDAAETPLHTVGGAVIQLSCPEADHRLPTAAKLRETNQACKSSALLVFSRGNPVLYCMLLQYNSTSTPLMRCIENDVTTDGVACIRDALQECFRVQKVRNALISYAAESEIPQLGCDALSTKNNITSVNAAVNLDTICGLPSGRYQDALFLNPRVSSAAAVFHRVEDETSPAAIWLGLSAYTGDWRLPEPGSALAKLIELRPLKKPGPYYGNKFIEYEVGETAPDTESGSERVSVASPGQGVSSGDTNPSFRQYPMTLLGAVTPAEGTYLDQLRRGRITHRRDSSAARSVACKRYNYSSAALPARMRNQASVSCALHFVVPGFMKAGTTYLFSTLMSHPQMLNTLRGVTFKETGCYGTQFTKPSKKNPGFVGNNRMHCFPFVEAHEGMYFGDGTVWYNSHLDAPDSLLADNPDVKVLFSIRDPVHRTQSQHRFIYKTLSAKAAGDLNEIVYYLLDRDNDAGNGAGSLVALYDQACAILAETRPVQKVVLIEQLVRNFQFKARSNSKRYRELNQFIKYSIYFPPIYYWFGKIPRGNIAVVPVELLQAKHQTVGRKLEFLFNLSTPAHYRNTAAAHEDALRRAASAQAESAQLRADMLVKVALIEDEARREQRLDQCEREWLKREAKIARERDEPLDAEYTAAQYNRIFRFLGLPEVVEVQDADGHVTGDKDLVEEHKLNETTKQKLRDFFRPFNTLLEDFLGARIGYNHVEYGL